MKKFMIFLLMAFLYLGTCQASNESASLSNDVGKSLRHWIAPSLSPSAGDELTLPVGVRSSMMPADSTVRVMLIGPSSACAGQVITLTAVVENNYWGEVSYQFRRNGNYITEGVDPVYKNRIQVTVPDLGGLDSLIQEYDVTVTQGCHTVISPVHYLQVNSINVLLLDSVLVCDDDSKGLMCAQVFGNYTEAPYSFVWYQDGTAFDTTYTPCKLLPVGEKYSVEPHFTWNACVAQSNESKVVVGEGPAEDHLKLDGLTASACNGNQVVATLSGLAKEYGQPAITWTLNGHVITTAHDSVVSFSPMTVAGEATTYILKAKVSYANYDCKEYTVQDTITMLPDPTVAIYGDAVICAGTAPALTAVFNGVLSDTTYIWKVDGVVESSIDTCVFNKKLSPRNYPYEISVIVTDSASCTAVSEPFMLYVDTANTVKLLSSASTVCKNDGLVTLTANVANADIPGLTYQWFKNVGTIMPGTTRSVTIGDSTKTSGYYPSYTLYNYSMTEQIYTADEIGSSGNISSVTFFTSVDYSYTRDIDIYMVHTDKTKFSSDSDWVNPTVADKVFSGSVTYGPGTVNITFDTPFSYDGDHNVALIVNDKSGTWGSSTQFIVTELSDSVSMVDFQDGISLDPTAITRKAYYRHNFRNKVIFTLGPGSTDLIDNAVTSTYTTTVTDATTFYVTVTNPASSCQATDSIMVNVYEDAPAVKPLVLETSNASICDGNQVMFTLVDTANLNQYPGAVASYQWTVNGVDLPLVTGTSYTAAPISSNADTTIYNIHIVANYQLECSTEIASIDTVVKVYRAPLVSIYGDAVICNPAGNVELSAVVNGIYNGKYTWKVDGVNSLVDTTAAYVDTLLSRDYPYEITVAINDTVTGCTVTSNPFMVYVGSNPVLEVTVSADTVCAGTEVVVTANIADINTTNLTYNWAKKDAVDSSHILGAFGPSITYTVGEDTKFFVSIEQNHTGCTAFGEDSVKVYEKALPVKPIALEVSDAYVCYGGQINFTVIDTANRKQYYGDSTVAGNYAWYLNGVRLNNVSGDHFTFSPSTVDGDTTNYLVEVVASYELQCETLTATVDTTVSVQSNPTVTINGDPIVCDTTALNLTAVVHNALDSVTYLWRVDGVDSTTGATFTSVLNQRDYPYEITVVINANTACEVVSDVYPVLIGINPTVAIGVSAPVVCKNDEVTLTAHLGDYNMPNLTYQWYQHVFGQTDTTAILVGTSRELTIPVQDTTRYMVKVSQVNSGCFAWGDTVINVYPKEPDPQNIELITSQAAVCFGGQIEFTVIDTANRKQYFGSDTIPGLYQWYKNGVLMPLVTTDHYIFTPDVVDDDSTNYLIEVVATYVTECETLTTSVDTTITAYPNTSVVITGDPFVCDTNLVRLYAIVNDTLISPSFLWRVDGADSLNLTTDTFEVALPYRDYPYEISVVVNKGTACEVVSEPYLVYVETQPVVVVTADYDTVCKNQIVTLTAHLGNYNQENLTYQWYADSVAIPEGTESTLAYTITNPDFTAFKVVVTQLNSNCQGTGFDTVITAVNPQFDTVLITNLQDDIFRIVDGDTINFHPYYNQPAYDVCEGASIQITAYMKDTAGNRYIDTNITYNWKRNGVEIEGVHGAYFQEQLSIIDHDLYKYIYTVEIAEPRYPNCYAEPVSASSDTVRVRRNPKVVIGGQQYVCYQGPGQNNILLQAWVDGAVDTNAIYNWYRDGQAEENPYNANYGAIFTGPFAPRYGYNYTFQVEVVTGSGCSSFSEPYEVTVMDAPIITITPSEDTVCQGGNVALVSHLDNYNVLDYELQYQWYANEVASDHIVPGATSPVLNIDVDETTNYIVAVEYLTENSNHPYCVAADTMTVSVYDRPQIDSIIMSLTEVCEGSQIELTAVMNPVHVGVPNVPYIYEWYRNSELLPGNAATIYDSPLTVDGNEQQYTYSVIVYQYPERMMCQSPIYVSSQTLTVYPNPIVAISGDQHVCHTDTIVLSANSDTISNPVGGLHYYWFESGAPIDNLNGDSSILKYYGAAQDEPYRFTVQVERDNASTGCRSYSYEYDVYVYESPVVNVTIVDENVCEGAEVTVTAHLNQNVPEQTNLEYQWYTKTSADVDYVLVPGATALTYTTTIFDTTEFMFKVVHTLTGCFDTDSKTINTFEIPVVTNITLSDTTVCEGSAITITAFIDSTKGIDGLPYFYEWRRNGELMPGNTNVIHDTPMTVDGTTESFVYSAIAYQTPERLACTSQLTESAPLIVLADPRVAISGDQTVCHTDNIILFANVDTFTNVVGGLHYTWYESGNLIENLNGDSGVLEYHATVQNEPYRFTVQIEREDAERGCRAYSEEYDVYVMAAPDATVTIVDEYVCEGAEVTVTAHLDLNDPEQTNLVYQWFTQTASDPYPVLVPGATALTYTTTINETTEFMFRVENTLSGCVDIDTMTIHTVEIPVVTNIAMSDTTVCEGAAITITAFIDSTKGLPGLPYFYEWRRNGELMPGNTNIIHDTPITVDGTTESFVYSAIAYQTPERLACTSELTESARLIVLADPRVAISGDQSVCQSNHIILYANVDTFTNVVGGLHYTWYESGNLIENLNGDSYILDYIGHAQNEPYRFTVQIEREDEQRGCRAYSEQYDVYVYEAPDANVTIVDEYVCEGAEVTVTAHLDLNDPEQTNLVYQWYTKTASDADFVLVPGATALTYTTTINETTEFKFYVENTLSGCIDIDYTTINVQPIPVVNYVSMSDTNICEGGQVTIYADVDATAGVAGQPYFFEWRRNGELMEGVNTQTITDSPVTVDGNEQTFVYSVVAYQTPERLACYSNIVESAQLNVFPNPRVAISGDQYVCATDSVFLYANVDTIARPVGLLHYTWYESGRLRDNMAYGLADSRFFSEYFYPQAEPYRFTVEVQRDDIAAGCRSYSEEFLVWVYEQPVVNITASETDVCVGGEVTLRANLNNYEFDYANDSQYQWYTVDTVLDVRHVGWDSVAQRYIDDTLRIVEHNAIPGATMLTYSAVMTEGRVFGFTATHNLSGCSDYDELSINVHPLPVIDSIINVTGKDSICPGGRVELVASVSGGVSGGEVFIWTRNGVVLESVGNTLIDYPLAVDNDVTKYVYAVVVRQAGAGCVSEMTESSQYTMWVVPNPTVELAGDPIVCDTTDNNIVIRANVVNYLDTTNLGLTYQWYENNAALEGETGLILSVHRPYRDYPYSFNFAVQNEYGCTVNSEPFLVYVNDNPVVHISASETEICTNGTVTLTADLYDQNADNLVFQWFINNDTIEGAYNATYTTTLTETSTFKVYVHQRDSHCAAFSNEVTVTVNEVPVVTSIDVVSVSTEICEGHVVTLKANIAGGVAGGEVYTWYKDNEIVAGVTGDTYTDYPMTSNGSVTEHVYNVTVAQTATACESVLDAAKAVTIKVIPNPTYTIYGDSYVCEPVAGETNIVLHGITNDPTVGTTQTYTWYVDGEEIPVPNVDQVSAISCSHVLPSFGRDLLITYPIVGTFIEQNPAATIAELRSALALNPSTLVITAALDEFVQDPSMLYISKPYREEPYIFKLIVTNDSTGCSSETAEFPVTVAAKPMASIIADQDSICEGGFVTLTSTLMDSEEARLTYQWQSNANGTWEDVAGAIAPVYVTSALNATTNFRLHVTNLLTGCENNSNEVTVTVKSTPVVEIININTNNVCNGGEVVLNATQPSEYQGIGEVSYQWFNNGQAIEGANSATYTTSPLAVEGDMTTYTFGVQVTMTNSGCVSNTAEEIVTVYADPTVVVTYDNGLTLCEGGQTILTANPNHALFTDFDYQWFFQGQPIQGANEATYVVENLGASQNPYEYAVEVKVNNGTTNGCSVVSEPVYVTIAKDPTAYITVNEGVNAICEGGNVTFTVNVNDGVADTYNPYTYEWTSNVTGTEILGTDASFTTSTADAANLYVYYVTVASAYGCNVTVADTLRIVEDPTVTVSVKTGADQVVCEGGFTTLIATVEGGLGEASYQWYKNGYAIEGANSRELVTDALFVNQAAAYTVSVAQSGIACTATSTQFNVPVYEAIEVALSANSEVNCVGGSVTLTATANNGIPGDQLSYQWYRNGNPINGANAATYTTDDNLIAGLYEYQVEVASTISGCHVAQSGTIGITVEAEPTIVITSNAGNSICEGGDITLTANVIYATNATQHNNVYNYTWKWYEGTTLMSYVTTEPHYTLPATMTAGTYNFFVEISSVDGLGCDATSLANNNNFFTVVVKPVPSVVLTASSDESCEGGDVTFNAVVIPTNLTGAYYWTVNGNTTVSNNNTITVNNMVLGTNNISVVFTPNDAQLACGTASVAITHTVSAAPVVTVAATDNNRLNMCVGGTIAFNATATGNANSSDNYVWTVDGQTQYGNNGTSFSTQLNTPGIHTVSAMVERTMGCNSQFSTPVVVVVAEQPVAQLTQTAGYTEMCVGGEITLMAKVANYATVNNGVTNSTVHGTYTYSWNRDNANIQTTTSTTDNSQITEILNTDAAYTYSVTITPSGFNCQAATATLDHSINVVPDPSWSVNQVNPSEMCLGGIVTLNAEVTGGVQSQQAGRIQWYKTFNGVESEVAGLGGYNTDVPAAAGVYTYAPKYIDYIGAGCNIADATSTIVTVNALPTAQFTSGHGAVICGGDYQSFATLEITLTGTAPYTFTIMNVTSGESQTIVTSLNPYYYNVTPAVTSIYRITSVSDANGCIGTLDNVADVVVNVSDITIAASSVVADCETWMASIPLQINAASSNTFTATLPNGSTQTGTIMFDSYTQLHYAEVNMSGFAPGAYIVTITVDGCSGQCVVNVPANDASIGASSALVDQRWDDVVVVNNNPANNGGYKFSTYQWYRNGELIPGATNQYYQEEGGLEGFYACELDGVKTDGTHVHFITCEKYFSGHASIRVYPVPATTSQEVTIELNLTDEELDGAILDIYDVKGGHIRSLSNLTPITKVGNFGAQGTYFGRIITGTNEIKTVKFIIVK